MNLLGKFRGVQVPSRARATRATREGFYPLHVALELYALVPSLHTYEYKCRRGAAAGAIPSADLSNQLGAQLKRGSDTE